MAYRQKRCSEHWAQATVQHGRCFISTVLPWYGVNENNYLELLRSMRALWVVLIMEGKRGRGAHKAIVVIAVEIKEPKGFGRVRMRHIPDASGDKLVPFVCDVVAPGTTVQTDGWGGYNDLQQNGLCAPKEDTFHPTTTLHTFLCRAFTVLRVCSSDGFSAHTSDLSAMNICNRTWRNLLSGSTGARHVAADWFFTDYLSRLSVRAP